MSVDGVTGASPARTPNRGALVGAVVLAGAAFIGLLLWAKWLPYGQRVGALADTGTWSGSNILTAGGVKAGDAPSWQAAVSFTVVYVQAVWKALVAALVISAAVQALVPRTWLLQVLNRRGRVSSAVAGGLCSTPSMMCTCCTAPVAVTLRRSGVSTAATIAYWLGNPLLNPAVLVFLALVAPWQWMATRLVVGVLVVVFGAALVARIVDRRQDADRAAVDSAVGPAEPAAPEADWLAGAPRRFVTTLLRQTVVLVPEYLIVVMLVGAFRGWLLPVGVGAGLVVVILAAIVGTLVVIPTAGEIPILQGLALAGVAAGPIGALLLTLPAVSLPGIAMVGRALGWRATTLTTVLVVIGGLLGAVVLMVL